ncbi:GntR family transcriptional regulator [Streptomyces sp. NBC_01549]|uniref:GntR family transcriptional regulator n=1 Tax=unclassified Streptomyces TaxID=2593676 RepID=UPI002259A338|nr:MULTISPECIES: GntR family transcriptional regulator [unclassified Streptomyces]MCX4406060.1 GntR family transcriptional regulator [Streptomyces sp. NBC_01764]MCX4596743.1 GntR family transcriptional regulator [Streptomyces sp. NBC_01549]MCX5189416.1 GntR family transcriptional regulator [Streptomyces sp. NBC_00268]
MAGEKPTRAAIVYARVREEIFQGEWQPGQRLRLVELAQRFDVSQSVVREALTRLSEQGLVLAAPQQGFSVVTVSLDDLNDLTEARIEIETMVLRRAIERGGVEWEAVAVAAHHHMVGTPAVLPGGEMNSQWFTLHEQFHLSLLEACGNDRLLGSAVSLRDAATLYRRWSRPVGRDLDRDIAGEHQQLLDAVLSRDADRAAGLLTQHIDRTSAALRSVITGTALNPGG